jgi:hypothetical protein
MKISIQININNERLVHSIMGEFGFLGFYDVVSDCEIVTKETGADESEYTLGMVKSFICNKIEFSIKY